MPVEGINVYRARFEKEVDDHFAGLIQTQKRQVGLALATELIQRTPVDTGEARKAWHFSETRPSGKDKVVDDIEANLIDEVSKANPDDSLYLQNNAAHIRVLEDGTFVPPDPGPSKDPRQGRLGETLVRGGYSVQAPQGIVTDAVDLIAGRFGLQRTVAGS